MKEASFYKKKDGKVVECLLCRHHCIVTDGSAGICGVRENSGGVLYARTYGLPCASHVDPIEKKPLFHFYPFRLLPWGATSSVSIARTTTYLKPLVKRRGSSVKR